MTAHPGSRRGYTLMEVVLVLGVICLLAAIFVPTLKGMYSYFKMNAAVDSVRGAWAQARARAIEEGRPYRFAVVADAGAFRVAPDQADYWTGSPPAEDPHGKGLVLEESLPKGVRFSLGSDSAQGAAGDEEDDPVGDLNGRKSAATSPDAYSTAAVFLPDGTARDDVLILFEVRGTRPVSIHLRGMTGAVTVKTLNN
jgi:prepilin-type N-terminal cleavage/methylation domain-containing protein